ncbi:MAG: hypothetical protein RDU20_03830 [Desulfomonilaceae bacterium]|nr:hypothetical protein [Desulfomonilaceae bacterium]
MTARSERKPSGDPGKIRTDRDWVMIVLGVCLTILFLAVGYVSIGGPDGDPPPKTRGPVKQHGPVGALPAPRVSVPCVRGTSEDISEIAEETTRRVARDHTASTTWVLPSCSDGKSCGTSDGRYPARSGHVPS